LLRDGKMWHWFFGLLRTRKKSFAGLEKWDGGKRTTTPEDSLVQIRLCQSTSFAVGGVENGRRNGKKGVPGQKTQYGLTFIEVVTVTARPGGKVSNKSGSSKTMSRNPSSQKNSGRGGRKNPHLKAASREGTGASKQVWNQ